MPEPRTYQIERDRFGLMYSGPDVVVGEMREVYEKSHVDAERERMLGLVERLLRERDENAAVAESLAERLNHEHGDYAAYACAMDELASHDLEAETLLRQHGRLSGGEGE